MVIISSIFLRVRLMKIGCEKVWIAAVSRLFLWIATRETKERDMDKRDECMVEKKKKKMDTKKSKKERKLSCSSTHSLSQMNARGWIDRRHRCRVMDVRTLVFCGRDENDATGWKTMWSEPSLPSLFFCPHRRDKKRVKERKEKRTRKGSISNTEALFPIIELVVHWLQPEVFKGAGSSSKKMGLLLDILYLTTAKRASSSLGHLPNVRRPCQP